MRVGGLGFRVQGLGLRTMPPLLHEAKNGNVCRNVHRMLKNGVAVKELKLSYYIGETLLFILYIPIMVT